MVVVVVLDQSTVPPEFMTVAVSETVIRFVPAPSFNKMDPLVPLDDAPAFKTTEPPVPALVASPPSTVNAEAAAPDADALGFIFALPADPWVFPAPSSRDASAGV
jgi:hypothetical protein